jgi:hypothetical protein
MRPTDVIAVQQRRQSAPLSLTPEIRSGWKIFSRFAYSHERLTECPNAPAKRKKLPLLRTRERPLALPIRAPRPCMNGGGIGTPRLSWTNSKAGSRSENRGSARPFPAIHPIPINGLRCRLKGSANKVSTLREASCLPYYRRLSSSDDDDASGANNGGASGDNSGGANNDDASGGSNGGARKDPFLAPRWLRSSRRCKARRQSTGLCGVSWELGFDSFHKIHDPIFLVHFQIRNSQRVSVGPPKPGPPAATYPPLVPCSFGLTQKA